MGAGSSNPADAPNQPTTPGDGAPNTRLTAAAADAANFTHPMDTSPDVSTALPPSLEKSSADRQSISATQSSLSGTQLSSPVTSSVKQSPDPSSFNGAYTQNTEPVSTAVPPSPDDPPRDRQSISATQSSLSATQPSSPVTPRVRQESPDPAATFNGAHLSPPSGPLTPILPLPASSDSFAAETAIGILDNSPLFRYLVLNSTFSEQRHGNLALLFETMDSMIQPPHIPDSKYLTKFRNLESVVDYVAYAILLVSGEVPQIPLGGFAETDTKEARGSIKDMRIALDQTIQFTSEASGRCNCLDTKPIITTIKKPFVEYEENFENTVEIWKRSVLSELYLVRDTMKRCKACHHTFTYAHPNFTVPEYPLFSLFDWPFKINERFSLEGDQYLISAIGLLDTEKKNSYVVRKGISEEFLWIQKSGTTTLNSERIESMLDAKSFFPTLIQMKKVPFLPSEETIAHLQSLQDPPVRIHNDFGICQIISVLNALLCLPRELRMKLMQLEVREGNQPDPNCLTPLWDLITGGELVVEEQKKNDWKEATFFPGRAAYAMIIAGILEPTCANKRGGSRIPDSAGSPGAVAMETLFAHHAHKSFFTSFAIYRKVDKWSDLDEGLLRNALLNIVNFSPSGDYPTVEQVMRTKPNSSLLIAFLSEPGHVFLLVAHPLRPLIVIDNDTIRIYTTISDVAKAQVEGFFCFGTDSEPKTLNIATPIPIVTGNQRTRAGHSPNQIMLENEVRAHQETEDDTAPESDANDSSASSSMEGIAPVRQISPVNYVFHDIFEDPQGDSDDEEIISDRHSQDNASIRILGEPMDLSRSPRSEGNLSASSRNPSPVSSSSSRSTLALTEISVSPQQQPPSPADDEESTVDAANDEELTADALSESEDVTQGTPSPVLRLPNPVPAALPNAPALIQAPIVGQRVNAPPAPAAVPPGMTRVKDGALWRFIERRGGDIALWNEALNMCRIFKPKSTGTVLVCYRKFGRGRKIGKACPKKTLDPGCDDEDVVKFAKSHKGCNITASRGKTAKIGDRSFRDALRNNLDWRRRNPLPAQNQQQAQNGGGDGN